MKKKSFSKIKFFRIQVFSVCLVLLFSTAVLSQTNELSLVDIFTALRSRKANFPEKNQLLTEGVKQRGVTFAISKTLEEELRNAGANDDLIEAIRQRSPKPEPTPSPVAEATPMPVATPKPPDYTFYQNRGNSNFVMGEYDSAINDYTKAIELNPKESSVFLSRGIAFYNSRKYPQAVADFDKVIELDPEESMAYYNRGNALEKSGEKEKALSDFQKAFELDKENDLAQSAFKRLQASMPKPAPPTTTPANTETASKETAQPIEAEKVADPVDPNEPVFVGSMQNLAKRLDMPRYPRFELQRNIEGLVTVQITIDEDGDVISAKATNGPKSLRRVSEIAARRSKFKPHLVNNKPVKATGFINYNFKVPS